MKYVYTDITEIKGPALIAHGVNCKNVMGSGVARALYTRWPTVKRSYHEHQNQSLGQVQVVSVEDNLRVANCFTQYDYGKKKAKYADPEAIYECLESLCGLAVDFFKLEEIHLPRIGCGLGGLRQRPEILPLLWSHLYFETQRGRGLTHGFSIHQP